MAAPAPTQAPAAAPASSGGFLARKVGPLPMWAWLAILTAAAFGWYLYEKHKSGTSSAPAQGEAQTPEIVIQNETTQAAVPPDEPGTPVPGNPPPVISVPPDKKTPLPTKDKKKKVKPKRKPKRKPEPKKPATKHPATRGSADEAA